MEQPVIIVENLVKKINDRFILNNISFNVERREIFGYLGPNGAGKTTTLRIILGLMRPTSGKALVLEGNLSKDINLRRKVGVILENDGLYNKLTAYENLDFYSRIYGVSNSSERDRRIKKLLDLVGLYDEKDKKVGYYSRGMRRRLAIARALIHDPEIVFMDEPTSGLDPEAKIIVRNLIFQLARERDVTIFLISHDLDEVERLCSRVAILVGGRIVALDTIRRLMHSLERRSIEITFKNMQDAMEVAKYLDNMGILYNLRGNSIRIFYQDSNISRVLKPLVMMGLKIIDIKGNVKSLYDVYLKIVRGG
ncbi:ABC transporter ATP-binding protein [Candidatus Geothermarchaeota archaeon]|nr:MAG: ABC transporter ATP-binding protein [Candidatus Geothermarchaeota archaeon]